VDAQYALLQHKKIQIRRAHRTTDIQLITYQDLLMSNASSAVFID
jgi:hypothetical protein